MEHHSAGPRRSPKRGRGLTPTGGGPRGRAFLGITAGLFAPEPPRRSRRPPYSSVGILGAGTAGLLAALVFRRKLPELPVTVLASPRLPVIGVGEASTPLLPAFLHGTLGLDPAELFRRVQPTLKLGIRFHWGRTGGAFSYPFERGRLLESLAYQGDLDHAGLASLAMGAGKGPLVPQAALPEAVRDPDAPDHLFLPAPFAYHLDNRRLARYLREEAQAAGVMILSGTVSEVETVPEESGGEPSGHRRVRAVTTEEGERLAFDLWVDASGFGSRLLGQALGVELRSYAGSLLTDAALVGAAPRAPGEHPLPHTSAVTRDHGWSWRIPQRDEDHLGYVYASAYASEEEAEAELRAAVPGLGEVRRLAFTPGCRLQMWHGNVVALGNAYAFVEPLESTSLHMVVLGLVTLLKHLPRGSEPRSRGSVNRWMGAYWDQLRDFLVLHFRHNRARDTPFWRACREEADPAGSAAAEALFRERAPLSGRPHLLALDPLWGDYGRDVILLGQGVEAPLATPDLSQDRWRRTLTAGRRLIDAALPHGEALALLDARPDLLHHLATTAPWLQDAAVGGREGW